MSYFKKIYSIQDVKYLQLQQLGREKTKKSIKVELSQKKERKNQTNFYQKTNILKL